MKKGKKRIYKGMKLYPWQKAVTDYICNAKGSGKVCVVKAPRQRGKSYMCEGILLHYAINQAHSINAMISPTLAQSRKVFKEIVNGIYNSGIIAKKNETLLEIELINGSTIFFKSSEMGDGLRGFHVDGILILDEAAYLTEDILELVLPWRQVSNAPMLLVSTPKIRNGVFYSYWIQGFEEGLIKSIDWCEWDTSCMISEEMIKQYKKVMTKNQFKSEILGEWLDDDGMVFTNILENTNAEEYDPSKSYNGFFVGVDFGAGGGGEADYTSITVYDDKGEMVFLDYFNDLGTFQQVERIISDLSLFGTKIKKAYMENNSIGSPFIDLILKTASERKLNWLTNTTERWTTTNASKNKLLVQFSAGLEHNEVKLLNDRTLTNQLTSYEATYNIKTQTITYNGAYGTHDDTVMSSMIGWYAYKNGSKVGIYSIGRANTNHIKKYGGKNNDD
jgi:hypothetical protein